MSWRWKTGLAAMTLAATMTLVAQAGGGFGGGGGGFGGGGFGGGGGRMTVADTIRQQVAFTDDEWTVIQPRLQRVLDAETSLGLITNRTFGRNFGGGQPVAQADPVQIAQQELSVTLQDQFSNADAITVKLKAVRDARAKVKEALAAAQEDLKKVLTIRQEAMLVNMGYLE